MFTFYDVCDMLDDDMEIVIIAISTDLRQQSRKVDTWQIRNNLTSLNLEPYRSTLERLSNLPKVEMDKYKILKYKNISDMILKLQLLKDNKVSIKRSSLLELKLLVLKLLEVQSLKI